MYAGVGCFVGARVYGRMEVVWNLYSIIDLMKFRGMYYIGVSDK